MKPASNPERFTVTGHRTQLVRIGTDHVGQRMRVTGIALGTGHGAAFAIPSNLQRVDRIHPISGCDQRLHPGTPIGLNADEYLGIDRITMLGNKFVQLHGAMIRTCG
jgi:hypothetical protein